MSCGQVHLRPFRSGAFWLLALAFACGPEAPSAMTYVETLGLDTTAVETVRVAGDTLTSTLVWREPKTTVGVLRVVLASDGSPVRADGRVFTEGPDGPDVTFQVAWSGDSATVTRIMDGEPVRRTLPADPPLVPALGRIPYHVGAYEMARRLLDRSRADSVEARILSLPQGALSVGDVWRRDGDTLALSLFGPFTLFDGAGARVDWADGRTSTFRHRWTRAPATDLDGTRARFVDLDRSGQALGVTSPRDSVVAEVGGATLVVDYGRPARRGRELWGGLVPFDEIWRTGANAATRLVTSRDIVFPGGDRLPRGEYSLWTEISASRATLIVNRVARTWGTVHDPGEDLLRLPLDQRVTEADHERLTFVVVVAPDGSGWLAFRWGRREYGTGFEVAASDSVPMQPSAPH